MLAAFCVWELQVCGRALESKVWPPQLCQGLVPSWQADIEQLDPRGRTPLHLATTLGHLECARVLLKHGADVGKENRSGWTGERVAAALQPPSSCPEADTGMEVGLGTSMDTDVDMDVGMNTGTGMVMLTLVLQLPKAGAHLVVLLCSAQLCSAMCAMCAMAMDIVPLPCSPAGGCEHP